MECLYYPMGKNEKLSWEEFEEDCRDMYESDGLDQCLAGAVVELCKGARVISLYNIDTHSQEKKVVNGSLGVIVEWATVQEVELALLEMMRRKGVDSRGMKPLNLGNEEDEKEEEDGRRRVSFLWWRRLPVALNEKERLEIYFYLLRRWCRANQLVPKVGRYR